MRGSRVIGWSTALALSSWASLANLRALPGPDLTAAPPPLPRAPTAEEIRSAQLLQQELQAEIGQSASRVGRAPSLSELEGQAPDGRPWLSGPLPDSPLSVGIATVAPGCTDDPPPPAHTDWTWCAATARLELVELPQDR